MHMPLAPGTRIADYTVVKKLGEGGMGEVYLCVHGEGGQQVVVKGLRAYHQGNESFRSRFAREAEVMKRLQHPNIVKIFNFLETPQGAFIVMEFVDGVSFDDLVTRSGRLSPGEAVELLAPVLRAVQFAHEQGVIHRDLKPSNFMLGYDDRVRVLDFGTAKLVSQPGITRAGTTLGTANYMSPEQLYGRDLGPQADVYSLGVCLYEMVTGRLPFEAEATSQLIGAIIVNEATRPSSHAPDLPRPLEEVILRCLAKKPEERYASASALAEALDRAVPPSARRPAVAAEPGPEPAPAFGADEVLASIRLPETGSLPTRADAKLLHAVGIAGVAAIAAGGATAYLGAAEPGLAVTVAGAALVAYAVASLGRRLSAVVDALDETRREVEGSLHRARKAVLEAKLAAADIIAGPARAAAAGGPPPGAEPPAPAPKRTTQSLLVAVTEGGDAAGASGARRARANAWRYAPLDPDAARKVTDVFDAAPLARRDAPADRDGGTVEVPAPTAPPAPPAPPPQLQPTAVIDVGAAAPALPETEVIDAASLPDAPRGAGEAAPGAGAAPPPTPHKTVVASLSEVRRVLKDMKPPPS
jgi:predicted Ser/Thr protein kinase